MNVDINAVIEHMKAELGNLVYQLAVKEAIIEQLRKELAAKDDAKTPAPADHPPA